MEVNFTLDTIKDAAEKLLGLAGNKKVLAFHGEMGAGKTTFIHALCEVLGVTGSISSPTYSIINEYTTTAGILIYHMDLYRLKDEEEALNAGVEESLYSGNFCLVEWPERAPTLFPANTVNITITVSNISERTITVAA